MSITLQRVIYCTLSGMITDTDDCYFNCCLVLAVTLASLGVFEREWKRILSHTPSQIWISPNTKWCDRVCVIVLRRSHWRPPSSAFVLPGVFRKLKSPRLRCDSMVLSNPQHAIICDTGPSTVWQLPPTTFWWPAVAPRPRSSSLAFYEPCRGSPWSCPSRSPGEEGEGSVFQRSWSHFLTGLNADVTDKHCWRHLVGNVHYTPALFYLPPLIQHRLQDLQVTPWSHRCPSTNTHTRSG